MPDHPCRMARVGALGLILFVLTIRPTLCSAAPPAREARSAISVMFRDEMQKAPEKLKWRGERLSDDTLYALALTGASWELAWGKDPMFSLAWGEFRKTPALGQQNGQNYIGVVHDIQRLYEEKKCREAVQLAVANFTLDQIGCDVFLKEPVGRSFLALDQPEQAFPIFAAPFEPPRAPANVSQLNRQFREAALDAAKRAGLTREVVAFALSLLLDPGADSPRIHEDALATLEAQGVDIDRVLLGILEAPERLRGLPTYAYAAADLLIYRISPRLVPVLLHLAESNDVYLRSRALLGLGIAAYRARPEDPNDWASHVAIVALREYGLSATQRAMIEKEIREGVNSDKYRVRAAAALATALAAPDDADATLRKLSKDRDYILTTPPSSPVNTHIRRIEYPVRMAAAVGLARFGVTVDANGADLDGKALETARRGGQDSTNDRRNLRKECASKIVISPLDAYLTAPANEPAGH